MPYKNPHISGKVLVALFMIFATTPVIAQQASGTVDSVTSVGSGRYRITGTALASDGNPACALALANGRCMFTCGAGSPRCEGGTASLPFGRFDLTDLVADANNAIILQIFVQGHISFTKVVPASGGGSAKWSALANTCCTGSSLTYQVVVDGVAKSSTVSSCNSTPSVEGFAGTTPGLKSFTSQVSSACGNYSGSGTATMAANVCYRFQLDLQGGAPVNTFGTATCPSSADAETLQADAGVAPMAIYPMLPTATSEAAETPTAIYRSLQPQR